jgi:hypothetical protein
MLRIVANVESVVPNGLNEWVVPGVDPELVVSLGISVESGSD